MDSQDTIREGIKKLADIDLSGARVTANANWVDNRGFGFLILQLGLFPLKENQFLAKLAGRQGFTREEAEKMLKSHLVTEGQFSTEFDEALLAIASGK